MESSPSVGGCRAAKTRDQGAGRSRHFRCRSNSTGNLPTLWRRFADTTLLRRQRSRVQSLHDAVEQYDMNALRGLVITGAPLTEVDDLNCTPLHNAVEPDCPEEAALEMVKIMLSSSPDEEERIEALCARSDEGLTPLHMVVKRGSVKLLDAMLSVIDEEIVDDVLEMKTHLTGSLFNGSWGKKQANGQIAELDVEHMTLLHMAFERLAPKEEGDDDEDPDNPTPPLSDAEKAETIAMIRQLIERGADVNARDANSRAPIHQAVEAGLHGMAELLLNAGADPTLGCKAIGMANNVLHQAVLRGDDQMAKTIIRCAPHLDVDAEGRTGADGALPRGPREQGGVRQGAGRGGRRPEVCAVVWQERVRHCEDQQ